MAGLPQGWSSDRETKPWHHERPPSVFDDWKGYLGGEHRCLVPLTRFAEACKLENGISGNAWFALSKEAPLTFFAGLVNGWTGMRRKDEGVMNHLIFAFFTTEPNDVFGAVHQKRCQSSSTQRRIE